MRRYLEFLHPKGAGGFLDYRRAKSAPKPCDIAALRPIQAVLGTHDYWQLAEHRRRCEELGGALFMRLARLIRAKMADATVVDADALTPDVVTGASRVSFALDRRRPETRTLYHWGYPDRERNRLPVGTFLGVTLIGMSVGQRLPLLDGKGVAGEVQVLAVHAQPASERPGHD
jgi:transcription elongation GreA/GreB family factor